MNTKKYYFYKISQHLVPIYPVYLLLFEAKGLSVSQISLLLAIWSVPVVFFEIPTGILADHWNRKYMLIIGSIAKTLCYTVWFFSDGFLLFALGFVLWGISGSFCSGSEEALLFDSLKRIEQQDQFEKIYGKGVFYEKIGVAISGVTGGILAMQFGMSFVLIISILSMLVCTGIIFTFKEINYYKPIHESGKQGISKSIRTLYNAITLCVKNARLLAIILVTILIITTAGTLDEYDPLIADRYGLNLAFVGIWGSTRYILEAVGGRMAYWIKNILAKIDIKDQFYAILFLSVLAGGCLGLAGWVKSMIIMPLYGVFYLIMASAMVLHEDFVQQQIEEQGRSTVHSLISLLENLYGIAFFGVFSFVLSGVDLHIAMVLIALYILLVSILLWILYHLIKRKAV